MIREQRVKKSGIFKELYEDETATIRLNAKTEKVPIIKVGQHDGALRKRVTGVFKIH